MDPNDEFLAATDSLGNLRIWELTNNTIVHQKNYFGLTPSDAR